MDFKQFYKKINFDIDNEIRTVYQATQGDTKSRGLLVDLIVGGVKTPVTTETMNFFALKPDGTRVMTAGVKDGDKFRIDFTNQTFSVAGTLLCALVLYGTNGEKIADKKFKMTVDASLEDGAIISKDERGILDRAFDLASDILPRIEALDVPLLENLEQRIDDIIATPVPTGEIIAEEIIDARQGKDSVGANITEVKSQLAEIEQQLEDGTAGIDDSVVSTQKVWSSEKVQGEINNIMTLPNAVYVSFPPHIPPETPVENMLWLQIEVPEIPEIPIPVDDYFFRFDASKFDLEDGAKISLWEDLSNNAHHLIQENPSDQPIFLKEGLNGKPTVQFTNNFMDVTPFDFDRRNTFTTFIMLQVDDKSISRSILRAGESGGTPRTFGFRVSSASDFVACYINNGQKGFAGIGDKPTFLYSTVYDGSSNGAFKDGVLASIPSFSEPITGNISSLRVGKALNNAEPYVGRVSEIVHFTRSLSDAERESVENYLMQKWGAV